MSESRNKSASRARWEERRRIELEAYARFAEAYERNLIRPPKKEKKSRRNKNASSNAAKHGKDGTGRDLHRDGKTAENAQSSSKVDRVAEAHHPDDERARLEQGASFDAADDHADKGKGREGQSSVSCGSHACIRQLTPVQGSHRRCV